MFETGDYSFSAEPTPLPLQIFHDTVQRSFGDFDNPESLEAQKLLLQEAITQNANQQPDRDAREAIFAYGSILSYLWFEPPDAPLPAEIQFGRQPRTEVEYHGELLIGKDLLSPMLFNNINELLRMSLLPLLTLRARNFDQNKEAVLRAIETYLAMTPAGQTLQQLGSNNNPLETRLDARQLLQGQAIVDSMASQGTRKLYGDVTSALMRMDPNARRTQARGYSLLEDQPGKRRIKPSGRETARRLAVLATSMLISNNPNLNEAAQATCNALGVLEFYDLNGRQVGEYEAGEAAFLLREVLPSARTLGADMLSVDLLSVAVEQAFQNAETRETSNMYASVIRSHAKTALKLLLGGFRLRDSHFVQTAMEMVKYPPGTPEVGFFGDADDPDRDLPFEVPKEFTAGHELEGDLEKVIQFLERSKQSHAHIPTPQERVTTAIASLVQDARQFLVIPAEAPTDVVFAELKQFGLGDPIVECLFTLYDLQASLEADEGIFASAGALLSKHVAYAEGLEALPAGLDKPEWYTSPRELAAALRRAVEPLITASQSEQDKQKK